MKIIVLSLLVCTAFAANYGRYGGYGHHGYDHKAGYGYGGLFQKVQSHYGNTAFAYNDGGSTRREHIRADGTVEGSYTVIDPNGNKRTVNYKAGANGFEVDGDTGVDKATADAAAEIAAQAPTAAPVEEANLPVAPEVPEVPDVELPVAPTNPPDYGKRNEDVYKVRKHAYGHGHHGAGYYGHGGYYGGGYYGGHGYGYKAPAVKVVKIEPKPIAAYGPYGGYGKHGGYGGYGHHGYGYGGLFQKVKSYHGNTAFAYNDGGSTRREHIAADGSVVGSYTVLDPNGNKRTVNYKAGVNGFEVDGDTGVDKATADAAAEIAAQAPTAAPVEEASLPVAPEVPEVPDVELPVAPTNPPDYGKRNEEVYKARKHAYGRGYGYYGHGGYGGYGYHGKPYGHGYRKSW